MPKEYFLKRINCSQKKITLDKKRVEDFLIKIKNILYPEINRDLCAFEENKENCLQSIEQILKEIEFHLLELLRGLIPEELSKKMALEFIEEIPKISEALYQDAKAIWENDPAAPSIEEVLYCYPGLEAIGHYRCAHFFYHKKVPILPRLMTEIAHTKTGIDIHPGAKIGARFCIDHGTGVVIGETAVIGNDVKIYQGVTIGAMSVSKDLESTKRHPTIEENCIIYSNATILGGATIIGKNSIIGGNVWLTKSIPKNSRVYHKSQAFFDGQFNKDLNAMEEIFYEI